MSVAGAFALRRPARAAGLTTGQMVRLVAWKALAAGRGTADRHGGHARAARAADRWGARWAARWGAEPRSMRAWLARAGAGALWLDVAEARDWAVATCTPADRALAASVVAGRVDLLGSGPVDVGVEPTFRRDLYSGREWPLVPASAVQFASADGSDIRTVWEQSRGYEVIALARTYWATGDDACRDAFVRRVRAWIRHNPVGLGPNWATPMDLAIRCANWALGAVLFADAPGVPAAFWGELLASLRVSARHVARHLEWHPVFRGNHYVANAVGLVYVGALFRDDARGARWLAQGARILAREIDYQVGDDGVGFEASLAYHRLDTELFGWAAEVLRRQPEGLPAAYERRLRAMYAFIDAYLPPGGLAPMLGDADDGRLHGESAEGLLEPRRHRLGLPARYWPDAAHAADAPDSRARAFPAGGFYVLRGPDGHAVVRCGPVGLRGAGSHDHNDQLAFELVLGGHRVVADSGTYAYTRDLQARHRFRGTAAHGVVQLGDEEQNPIRPDRPWRVLGDRTRAACTEWTAAAGVVAFAGRHHGFAHRASGAVVERRLAAAGDGGWTLDDAVLGTGDEELAWRLHLGPGLAVRHRALGDGRHELLVGDAPTVRLTIALPPALTFSLDESSISDRYGQRTTRPCVVARGRVALPCRIAATLAVVRP